VADSMLKGMFGGGESDEGQGAASGNPLAGLFGGGNPREDRAGAEDFINRVTTGAPDEGFSEEEALSRLAQASHHASPGQMHRAAQQAVSRLDDNQRDDFAKMLQERMGGVDRRGSAGGGGADDLAGMLGQIFGGGGSLGGLLGGLMGGGQNTNRATQDGDGGAGGMLGGLFGSSAGKAVLGGLAAYALSEILDGKR
jgi:hypothetical protein